MPNRLLESLGADYTQLADQYEAIVNRCADEGRDPNEGEVSLIEGLRSQMTPLGERILELRSMDEQRMATAAALTNPPDLSTLPVVVPGQGTGLDARGHPVVQVRSDELIYRPADAGAGERQSFFRDIYADQFHHDVEARSRLDRHELQMRAATTTNAPGSIPPTWLTEEFAAIAHGARPTADTIRRIPITDANPVTVGIQSAGAVVTDQVTENTPPADGDFRSTPLVTVPRTKTGKVDVSRQLLDGSNPAVDGLVFSDVMGAYNENIEQMCWTAMTAMAGAGLAYNGQIDASDPDDRQYISDGVIIGGTYVRTARKSPPTVVLCSENLWGNLMLEKDGQGRPLIVSGWAGPSNARGIGDALTYGHVAGQVGGLPVVPSWAGTTAMYVVKADDNLLLESSTFNFRYEEVLGPETIRLGVWGYANVVLARFPKGWARITVIPPTGGLPAAGADVAPEPAEPDAVSAGGSRSRKGNGESE